MLSLHTSHPLSPSPMSISLIFPCVYMCTHIYHIFFIRSFRFHILAVVNNAGGEYRGAFIFIFSVYIEIEGVLVCFFVCLYLTAIWHVRSYFPDQESNPAPCSEIEFLLLQLLVCVYVLSRFSSVWLFATPIVNGLWTVAHWLICPWDSPGENAVVIAMSSSRIFRLQGSKLHLPCLLHCRQSFYYWATREALICIVLDIKT